MDTLELNIDLVPREPWNGILIAELAELGFDSFVETKTGIQAYGSAELNIQDIIAQTCLKDNNELEFTLSQNIIPHQNWNSEWEKNFQPVYVEDFATILAPFHDDSKTIGLKVVIQPQMSFGTGHHQTTWLMSKALFELEVLPEIILDMGTGTGVLAIIAEKLGAKRILGIDIEDWSAENALANAGLNGCKNIEIKCGDIDLLESEQFGLILANINKNVLKSHMSEYANHLSIGGTLLLSGFFVSDVNELEQFAKPFGLQLNQTASKDEWAMMHLTKTN